MTQIQLPAHLQALQVRNFIDDVSANLGAGSPPYISIKNNRFTLVDANGEEEPVETFDPKTGPYLDCIVADANEHLSKIYYDKPYDPAAQQYEPPACFSDNGIGPSRSAAKPQSTLCMQCPNAVWGSKISAVSNKGVKACSDTQKLAVMIPGDDVLFLLRVPPNSLTNLRAYVNKFKAQGVPMQYVMTRITFVSQGTLDFAALNFIGETEAKRLAALGEATAVLVGRTDTPRPEALPPAQTKGALPLPQTAPQSDVPPAALPSASALPAQPGTGATTAAASPPAGEPTRRRRRSTAAPEQVAGAPLAPFSTAATPAAAAGNGAAGGFGMQAAAPAPADIESTLNSIFGPAA